MTKIKSKFFCAKCGYETPKWMGRCPGCEEWNTLEEEILASKNSFKRLPTLVSSTKPQAIESVGSGAFDRYNTQIEELNRVLGGGIVRGSLILISGEPGIGKSTLILQMAATIAKQYGEVLYVSGEESEEQIKMRAERLRAVVDGLFVISETNINVIEKFIDEMMPVLIIVDSVQTLYKDDLSSAPGSVSQVKECVNNLMRISKLKNIPIFIVAHVTKQGELAGPRVLEHMVDTVLHFEGERTQEFRILRALKNRFGTTSEIGVFEMEQEGLVEISNPSAMFLDSLATSSEGSIVVATMEGTRPLLVEIQALAVPTIVGFPRRTAVGVDLNRLNLIIAVLEKKMGLPLSNYDIYVNVVGGLKLEGTCADLGLAIAIHSSFRGEQIATKKLIAVGEISLTADLRPVAHLNKMLREAAKMGFSTCIIPSKTKTEEIKGLNIRGADNLETALNMILADD
ncbi:MAG: DNA repair protein RadA [Clostridiales bacterium]|nr:DNA repair protein RadA [Clostridiales bacterium]